MNRFRYLLIIMLLSAVSIGRVLSVQDEPLPRPVIAHLISIDKSSNAKGSILAVTPNYKCVLIRVTPKSRTLKNGSQFPFSKIPADTQLVCKGFWDNTTSPPSFKASEILVGDRVRFQKAEGSSGRTTIAYAPVERKPQVELTGLKAVHKKTHSTVTGTVKNISQLKITNLQAVVKYYTKEGRLILSDTNTVSKAEIKPGESAGFEITTNWESEYCPVVENVKIEFHSAKGNLAVKQQAKAK